MSEPLRAEDTTDAVHCRCGGTGWVKVRIPSMFAGDYDGRSFGWAGCPDHPTLGAEHDPPPDGATPDPAPYEWESKKARWGA